MTDPTFETREALADWESRVWWVYCLNKHNPLGASNLEETLARIRRVTAAHQHLMETPDVDAQ